MGLGVPSIASAGSHLWEFGEVFSSVDGRVQFIEMHEVRGSNFETGLATKWFATNSYNTAPVKELLGHNLSGGTAFRSFLVGTESYAALPGVPAPDYVLPDGFFDPSGDTILWWTYRTLTLSAGGLPTDGLRSLRIGDAAFTLNSPTNFAGETGTLFLADPNACPGSGRDADRDGVCAEDNCPAVPNPLQLDSGGVADPGPDSIGDACQCGDVDDDGRVDPQDTLALREALAGLGPAPAAPHKCNAIGAPSPEDLAAEGLPDDCRIDDAVVLRRALLGLPPAIGSDCGGLRVPSP